MTTLFVKRRHSFSDDNIQKTLKLLKIVKTIKSDQ